MLISTCGLVRGLGGAGSSRELFGDSKGLLAISEQGAPKKSTEVEQGNQRVRTLRQVSAVLQHGGCWQLGGKRRKMGGRMIEGQEGKREAGWRW